jgi:hypothetical protein
LHPKYIAPALETPANTVDIVPNARTRAQRRSREKFTSYGIYFEGILFEKKSGRPAGGDSGWPA